MTPRHVYGAWRYLAPLGTRDGVVENSRADPMPKHHRPKRQSNQSYANQLMYNPDDCGRTQFSKAAGKYMKPTRSRRIHPSSPEGQAIAARLTEAHNQ